VVGGQWPVVGRQAQLNQSESMPLTTDH
jgi:hypothetical protein